MRVWHWLMIGTVGILAAPLAVHSQPPMMGGPSMMGGGMMGGRGGFSMDPGAMFDRIANGKPSVSRSDLDSRGQWFWDNILVGRMGFTGSTLTREDFSSLIQQRMGGGGGPGGPPSMGSSSGSASDAYAESGFRRRDRDSNGLLSVEEMSDTLRSEREKWDTNKDGFIDLTEYKAYVAARMGSSGSSSSTPAAPPTPGLPPSESGPLPIPTQPEEIEDARPTVYRAGKLPKDLPEWFKQCDSDGDAQVGLYEWRAAGRRLDDFHQYDRNGDGFITVEEVLWHTKLVASGKLPSQDARGGMMAAMAGGPDMMGGGSSRGGPPMMGSSSSRGGPPMMGSGSSRGGPPMMGGSMMGGSSSRGGPPSMGSSDRGSRGSRSESGGKEKKDK